MVSNPCGLSCPFKSANSRTLKLAGGSRIRKLWKVIWSDESNVRYVVTSRKASLQDVIEETRKKALDGLCTSSIVTLDSVERIV